MKKGLIIAGVIVIALLAGAGGTFVTLRNQEQTHFEAAQTAFTDGNFNEAVSLYNQAMSVQPDAVRQYDEAAMVGRTLAHFGDGNHQAAIDDATAVLASNPAEQAKVGTLDRTPNDIQSRQNLLQLRADSYIATSQHEPAIADLTQLLETNSDNIELLQHRAAAYEAMGNIDSALADVEAIIALDSTQLDAQLWRYTTLINRDATEAELLTQAEAIMAVDGTIGFPFLLRGLFQFEQRHDDAALADFVSAEADEATKMDALAWQAVIHLLNEQQNDAISKANLALDAGESHLANLVLGAIAAQNGELAGVEQMNTAVSNIDIDTYHYALYLRGLTLLQMGESAAALSDAELIIAIKPQWAWGHSLRGEAHLARLELPQAQFSFQQAIDFAPEFGVAYAGRGGTYLAEGNIPAARADLDQALSLQPTYLPAIIWRAETAVAEENLDEALAQLEQALQLVPDSPSLLASKGEIYLAQENWGQAIEDFTAVLQSDSNNQNALSGRGIAYFELSEYDNAINDLSAAIVQDAQNANLILLRAEAHLQLEDLEAALRDSNRVLRLDDNQPLPYLVKGLTLIEEGNNFQAAIELTEAIDLDPNLAEAYAARGRAYFRLEDYDRARADASRAIELNPDLGEGYVVQALIHTFDLEWREAIDTIDRAVELLPDDILPYQTRGIIYLDSGDANSALDDFDQVIALDPANIDGYLLKAAAYDELARYDDAIESLNEALALANEQQGENGRIDVADVELAESTIADLERIPVLVDDRRTWSDSYTGFTVTYPGDWRQFVDPGAEAPIFILGPLDKDYRSNLSLVFLEFDFRPDLNDLVRFYNIDSSQFDDFELITDERISVDGRSAVRRIFSYTASDQRLRDVSFTITQVYIVDGDRAIIVTAFSRSEDAEKYNPIFADIVSSLDFD